MNNIIKQSIPEETKRNILNHKKYLKKNPQDINVRLNLAYIYVSSYLINEAIREYKNITIAVEGNANLTYTEFHLMVLD